MRPFGLAVIAALIAYPLFWFLPLAQMHDPGAVFSQYIGSVALIAMGLSQLLATRWAGLETLFGGLDRMYILHKWLGIIALGTVVLHDTIDADIDGIGRETALTDLAETLGEISLYGFLALVLISVITFVPYRLWRLTHKFMGALFAMSAFHFVFIMKPFETLDPVGLYVSAFCVLGIVAYIFTLLPYRLFHGRHRYDVSAVEPTGDAVAITLQPRGKPRRHHAGQFAFVRFDTGLAAETHPFTISSAPKEDGSIRFTIKPLGGDTRHLAEVIQPGMKAQVSRPFGHFRMRQSGRPQIWIAAGVGITPFVAWAGTLNADAAPIDLFYCVRDEADAAHLDELRAVAAKVPQFRLHLIPSRVGGRLTSRQVSEMIAGDVKASDVYFCGPKSMREDLRRDFKSMGLRHGRFHYEEFEIRSGIGLQRLAKWLIVRVWNRVRSVLDDMAIREGSR